MTLINDSGTRDDRILNLAPDWLIMFLDCQLHQSIFLSPVFSRYP